MLCSCCWADSGRGHWKQHCLGCRGRIDAYPHSCSKLPARVPSGHQRGVGCCGNCLQSYRAYDLEGKTVGTVGAGRIGRLLLQRLKPFNCNLLYHDRLKMEHWRRKSGQHSRKTLILCCQNVTLGIFDKNRIAKMKKGVLVVNNARGAIMDTQAVADACSSGHIAGYSGDVWYPQPAPKDHPWQYMPNQAMTPHISGTTIDAQLRYAGGTNDMLDRYFKGEEFPAQNYIVKDGQLARCCVVGGALLRMSVINRPLSTMSFRTLAM